MPMISDLDIYRSAQVLIREHGEDAALEAAMRADHGNNQQQGENSEEICFFDLRV